MLLCAHCIARLDFEYLIADCLIAIKLCFNIDKTNKLFYIFPVYGKKVGFEMERIICSI